MLPFNQDPGFHVGLAQALLPEDYSGNLLAEIPGMVADGIAKGLHLRGSGTKDADASEPKQSEVIIKAAEEAGAELFNDARGETYISYPEGNGRINLPVRSRDTENWLRHQHYKKTGRPPASNAVREAVDHFDAKARFDAPREPTFIRLAAHNGAIYVDLGDTTNRAVRLTADRCEVVDDVPARLLRPHGAVGALPLPEPGFNPEELRLLLGMNQNNFILLIAFMIACLHPDGPYFILQIHGEQGSGKSIIGKLVKDTLDPNQADRLRLPQTEQDLAIFAQAHWILNFENVSGMSADISDALCTVATGGAIAKRRLYTDSDQVILRFKRPIAINGIGDYASRPDLQERSIPLFLETIGPDQRKTESELNAALEVLTPKLLGYLFDCAAYALAHLHEVEVPRTIRMADAAHWLLAAEPATAFEPGSILRALEEVQGQLISRTVANDNVTVALLRLLHRRAEHRFEGRYGQLHEILRAQSEDRGRHLPRSPSALSSRLERLKPALRKIGLVVEDGARLASGQTVVIHLTPAGVALAAEFGDDDHDRGPSY